MTTSTWRRAGGSLAAVCLLTVFVAAQGGPGGGSTSGVVLSGTVKSANGQPLEGVIVSARAAGKTFTTSVYTNEAGAYSFPAMAPGRYQVWAQAVGFDAVRAGVDLAAPGRRSDLTLPQLQDFESQLTGEEWMASIPATTPAEHREKALFTNNCTACHQAGFPLQNRFDGAGWQMIVDLMARTGGLGSYQANRIAFPIIDGYREELAAFLTRHRGPNSKLTYKLAPRPRGQGARAVVVEYDLPPGSAQDYFSVHNGTDWSKGTPSAYEGRSAHDVAVAPDGNIWFTDQANPDRTIGVVDVKTGEVKGWKMSRETSRAAALSEDNVMIMLTSGENSVGTHSLAFDAAGNVWFGNATEGSFSKFTPSTQQFTRYPRPDAVSPSSGAVVDIDAKGNVWSLTRNGAIKLDPATGVYTEYKSLTPGGDHYGMAIDSQDNVWWTQIGADRISYVDTKTGKVGEIVLPPSNAAWITDKDRAVAAKFPSSNISAVPQAKGPRRSGADKTGDSIWIGQYFGDKLMRININTKAVTEYPAPRPYMQPYAVAVDKNHMVWVTTLNTDRLLRFDPSTQQFTEVLLPTRGTEIRHIAIDNRGSSPTVWVPYWRANKIASIQLR